MSNSNQENSVTAPHDLYFLSAVSNLTLCGARPASLTSRFVKPCTIDFPPAPEHGLPLFCDPTCCWLGSSEIYKLCVVPQVLEKVRDHCALQVCAPPLFSTQAQRSPAEHDPVLKALPIH